MLHDKRNILATLLFAGITACNTDTQVSQEHLMSTTEEISHAMDSSTLMPVESFSSEYFPCNDCHSEIPPNPQRRELVEMHDDILFDHDSENRWCLACHSESNRDSLELAGGKLLGFDESYRLCGQCHGPKIRDWKLGIHGKRSGQWNGQKQYLLCVHCHDPHSPQIKKFEPMPVPRRPEEIKIDSIYESTEETNTSP